jgi:glycoside/pentoside/hexuronide:cation symporter, GPH family
MFDFLNHLGLTAAPLAEGSARPGGIMEVLGYIVHGTRDNLQSSNVADVFNSIANMIGTATMILVIFASASFARRFGKKAVAVTGFGLSTINALAFYLLNPDNAIGMIAMTIIGSAVYAPTVPLLWAMFADVADYSELNTGRRFTGTVFATIGFCLKAGLALGSASFLWIMEGLYGYDTKAPDAADAIIGYRATSSLFVALMFGTCTLLLIGYKLNKEATIKLANELEKRRSQAAGVHA